MASCFSTRWDAYCFPHTYFFSNTRSNLPDNSQVYWATLKIVVLLMMFDDSFLQGCVNDALSMSLYLNGQYHLSVCLHVALSFWARLDIWNCCTFFLGFQIGMPYFRFPDNKQIPQQWRESKPVFFLDLWFSDFPLRPVHQVPPQHGHCEAGEQSYLWWMSIIQPYEHPTNLYLVWESSVKQGEGVAEEGLKGGVDRGEETNYVDVPFTIVQAHD